MGVAIIGGMALAGAATGVMSQIGANKEAQAQWMQQKVEIERNNFQQAMANDKKNFAAARQNALRRWNNKQIAKTATRNYSDTLRFNREQFQTSLHNSARTQISTMATLASKATGKNLRGGTADLIQRRAKEGFKTQRSNLYKEKYAKDTSAEQLYEQALNQRDLLSYDSASIYIPGDIGMPPKGDTLSMLTSALSGGIGGAATGTSMASGLSELGYLKK